MKAKLINFCLHQLTRLGDIYASPAVRRLRPQHHILPDRVLVDQQDLLVDHANARRNGCSRIAKGDGATVIGNRATRRRFLAIEHFHQGTLARAIFADDGVDLPIAEVNRHLIQRYHLRRIDFGDGGHLDQGGGWCGHKGCLGLANWA